MNFDATPYNIVAYSHRQTYMFSEALKGGGDNVALTKWERQSNSDWLVGCHRLTFTNGSETQEIELGGSVTATGKDGTTMNTDACAAWIPDHEYLGKAIIDNSHHFTFFDMIRVRENPLLGINVATNTVQLDAIIAATKGG